jgi:uncharacterized damage-inducible protein DinB
MISLELIHDLFEYNYWSRDQQLAACGALTPEQFVWPLGGSFPSVRDTLAHLVDGEAYALQRWRGRSRQEIIAAMGFSRVEERLTLWPEQFPTLAAVEARGRALEIDVRQYLATLTAATLEGAVSYVDSSGRTWTYPLWRMLVHHVNHQTYHRGQVSMFLRQLGRQPPPIDFLRAFDAGVGKR